MFSNTQGGKLTGETGAGRTWLHRWYRAHGRASRTTCSVLWRRKDGDQDTPTTRAGIPVLTPPVKSWELQPVQPVSLSQSVTAEGKEMVERFGSFPPVGCGNPSSFVGMPVASPRGPLRATVHAHDTQQWPHTLQCQFRHRGTFEEPGIQPLPSLPAK